MTHDTRKTFRVKPTEYEGYTFRSRTEARWAVFFDALRIKWDYEPQGFEFGGKGYLPDFWLPDLNKWVEIKGEQPTLEESHKCSWLADGTHADVLLFWDAPRCPEYGDEGDQGHVWLYDPPQPGELDGFVSWDNYQWWCECPRCGFIDVCFEGRSERLRCRCITEEEGYHKVRTQDSATLKIAYASSKRAFTGPTYRGGRHE